MRPQYQLDFAASVRNINENRLLEAADELTRLTPATIVEYRMKGHLNAKLLMRQKSFDEAIVCLERTVDEWGEHVGLLGDLATCHYLKGDTVAWAAATDRLASAFNSCAQNLCLESHVRTALLLGKFEEERGELASAINAFETSFNQLRTKRVSSEEIAESRRAIYLTLAQLVRVRALYQPGARLGEIYVHLLRLNGEQAGSSIEIEAEHSLLQAELALIGAATAKSRLLRLLKNPLVDSGDRSLLLFDFIEASLRRGEHEAVADLRGPALRALTAPGSGPYEETLLRLAFDSDCSPDLSSVDHLLGETPLAGSLRLLTLMIKRGSALEAKVGTSSFRDELRRKALLLISGLTHESRLLWMSFLEGTFIETGAAKVIKQEILLDPIAMTAEIDTRTVSLGRKRNMVALLEALGRSPELPLADACRALWGADFNESYYHRLRIQAHRLNELLLEYTAIAKAIKVDTQTVRLDPRLQVRVK